jgi:hypothetical protein
MPDVFGTPQDKAANTASRLGSRYNANTAWSSLDATPSWQLGGDRFAQYSQHLPRRGYSQINISVNPSDIEIDRTSVASLTCRHISFFLGTRGSHAYGTKFS